MKIGNYILRGIQVAGTVTTALPAQPSSSPLSFSHDNKILNNGPANLTVDLGYAKYRGFTNATTNINHWVGIRYAAPPIGKLRFQAPQPPLLDRSRVVDADSFSKLAQCPQTGFTPGQLPSDVGAEDCLFLSVYSPINATNLPVFIWIHGGGFQNGNGKLDFSPMMQQSNNSFVTVIIQYRLNIFGFLSSADVKHNGQLNAGLLDQKQAFEWVQSNIHLFGGDPSHVTLGGESAGAASIYYHTVAQDGLLGSSLWTGSILSSAAVVKPYHYSAAPISKPYYRLAEGVGCITNQTVFQCLVDSNFSILLNMSNIISVTEIFGVPPFSPVIDEDYLTGSPAEKLLHSDKLNGKFALVGNQANEGFDFVPTPGIPNPLFPLPINTTENLSIYLQYIFPLFNKNNVEKVLAHYPETLSFTNFDELSFSIPQELANNVVAEPVFYCPSQWFGTALSKAWRYQFSIPPALHASDLSIYESINVTGFGNPGQSVTDEFRTAFLQGWINFILNWDPSNEFLGQGVSSDGVWPLYNDTSMPMVNFNVTGGMKEDTYALGSFHVPQVIGGKNDFGIIDERGWQDGRGIRCDLWRALGSLVPV